VAAASPADDAAERAAQAAERAAAAAERSAAAAAERLARSLETAAPVPPPAPVPPVPPTPPKPSPWTLTAGVGLISLTGNAQAITLTGNVDAQRKAEKWILTLKAMGSYGQSVPAGAPAGSVAEITALSALFSGQADYRFSDRISAFIASGVDTDHVKSVEVRGFGGVGVGIIWLDQKDNGFQRSYLTTDIGLRYQRENRFQYFPAPLDLPDVDLLAPRVAGSFRYALNKEVLFQQDVEVLPNVLGPSRVLVNTLSKISARLVSVLSVGMSFAVKYDSRPAEGRVPTDTQLTVGLEAAL
jgi:hypothetical protein